MMQADGLKERIRKRYKATPPAATTNQPIAANLLRQDFTAERRDQRWAGDTSEFRIAENGKAYRAAILELYSRAVVGWAIRPDVRIWARRRGYMHLSPAALDSAIRLLETVQKRAAWSWRNRGGGGNREVRGSVETRGWLANRSSQVTERAHLRQTLRWATFA